MKNKTKAFIGIFIVLTLMFSIIILNNVLALGDGEPPSQINGKCYQVKSTTIIRTAAGGPEKDRISTGNIFIKEGTVKQLGSVTTSGVTKKYYFYQAYYNKDKSEGYIALENDGGVLLDKFKLLSAKNTFDLCFDILNAGKPVEPPTVPKVESATPEPVTPIETPKATDISPGVWTQIKWDFEKLCLGENKELSALKDKYNYIKDSKDCLDGFSKYSDIAGMTIVQLKQKSKADLTNLINREISGGIPLVFITTIAGKKFADGGKVYSCLDKLSNLKNFISDDKNQIFTTTQTIKGLKTNLDSELTKEISDTKNQIDTFDETHRATGWFSAERWVSLISCAYGVAGGVLLAKDSGNCEAEVPLVGTEHCDECGDAFMPCTAERCGILGNCRAIAREDGKGYMCLPGECVGDSSRIPVINQIDMAWYQGRIILNDSDRITARAFNRNTDTDLIDNRIEGPVNYLVNTLNLTITTSNEGKCGYSFENGTAFASMTYFDNAWKYPLTQSAMIDLSGLALGRTHVIYIKCESTCGSVNELSDDSQYVKFTFESRPDGLPPEIVRVIPDPNTQYINNESRYATIEVWLNENGYCKYSTINETGLIGTNLTTKWNQTFTNGSYMAQMSVQAGGGIAGTAGQIVHNVISTNCIPYQPCGYVNELGSFSLYRNINNCTICYFNISTQFGFEEIDWDAIAAESASQSQQDQNLRDLLGERGLTALGLTGKSKLFHYEFRCADFGRNRAVGTDDNIMPEEETYDYQIFTYPPFNMTIIEPRNGANYYLPVPLEVETSRETVCKYIACGPNVGGVVRPCNNSWENMVYIDGEDNYGFNHKKELENLTYGLNRIYVRCRDRGNLEVMNSTVITVLQDLTSPMIIRMAHSVLDNSLLIETNEKADCVVSFDKLKLCNYNFTNGIPFMTTDNYVHSYTWTPSSLHYVKCKDRWNNYPGGRSDSNVCTAIIDPIEIPEI